MNRHPDRRSPAELRHVLFLAVVLDLLVSLALVVALVPAGGSPNGPRRAPAGLAL